MHEPFVFSKIMQHASPLVNQWAIDNFVFLFDFDELMYDKDTDLNLEATISRVKYQGYNHIAVVECHPFVDRDERYAARVVQLNEVVNRYAISTIFLTADWRLWCKIDSIRTFFPAWYFRLRSHALKFNYKGWEFPNKKRYNFSCCNMSNIRAEKILNYLECIKRRRPDWYVTIYDRVSSTSPRVSEMDISKDIRISQENRQLWNTQVVPTLREYKYDLLNGEQLNAFSTIFPGHTDAYCNLVVEHSSEIEIVSEKSFKPFIAEQIPVYVGQKGITRFVESLGFDVFRDFIDYTKYDTLDSFVNRIEVIHQEIDKVYQYANLDNFLKRHDVRERLKKNRELFYSDHIDQLTISHLNKLLKQ